MKSLSIAELQVPNTETKEKTEEEAASGASVVGIEVVLHVRCLASVVHNTEEGTDCSVNEGGSASED